MLIKDIFQKDIFRGINGVVKADQTDEASVWQELDEFVITRELDRHLRDFFGWYTDAWEKIKKANYTKNHNGIKVQLCMFLL
jgi:hypothetical protein